MTYVADLGQGQSLTIENAGTRTIITWESRSAGQQQRQQMSLSLGQWSASPMVFKTTYGFVLQIESNQTASYVRLQANSISVLSEAPLMLNASEVPLRYLSNPNAEMPDVKSDVKTDVKPTVKPLEPLRMGNMTMQLNPMEMSMGNMSLSMEASNSRAHRSTPPFCSQCGTKIQDSALFCPHCGTKLVVSLGS